MYEPYFAIKDGLSRDSAIQAIRRMEPDGRYAVHIRKHVTTRTAQQNRLYRIWLELLSDETGYTDDDLHEIFKSRFLGTRILSWGNQSYTVANSTVALSTKQFTEYLTQVEETANLLGVNLPHPEDLLNPNRKE